MSRNKREKVFAITEGKCYYCGIELDFENFHIDHYIPKSKRRNDPNNYVPSCPDCNLAKSDLSIEEFRNKIQGLMTRDITGRLIAKYYGVEDKKIRFYFEK